MKKLQQISHSMVEELKLFLKDQEQHKDFCCHHFYSTNIVLQVLARAIRHERKIKDSQIKTENYLFIDDLLCRKP